MERRTSFLVLIALLLPCIVNGTIVIDEKLLVLPQEELAAHISGLLSRPGAAVTTADLPSERPPVQWMCDYSCAQSISLDASQGLFTLDMT
jgi:hypothetical protein